ncbi:hypothetical protein BAOM_3021 [Peribacillus asahii]|uniref:Uncharacterized protein n=1 Tax=Peribacillus asahii TaxID=228899 RepID=A0A3T0KTL1_9BACI|nr:hypothetical protein [Peribacillus asahii]AZV43630.1 hypothetical protein BAOM_3021 [Peribacillus asahii]
MKIKVDKIKKGLMRIHYIKEIEYMDNKYRKINRLTSQVGDVALTIKDGLWTTKGEFYLLQECYPPNGFKGIIADDGNPMGIHDDLGGFDFYRRI